MATYDKALDKEFWKRVREDAAYAGHREDLQKRWAKYCSNPITDLRYRDFTLYYRTGDRRTYERDYFDRHQALNTAALMACIYPDEPEYLARAQDQLFSVLNEYTWVLPAHQKTLENFNPVHIDLFAAETALNVSEVYMLLRDRLDPFLLRRIQQEIRRRTLEPYLARPVGGWETAATNWTAVCTCGVAVALMNVFPEEAEKLIPRFVAAAQNYLSGFGEDGYCPEGPMYWAYGFGFFTALAERLRSFCGIDLFQDPKVERMATFFQKMYLCEDVEVTFADADMGNRYNHGIMHFLRNEYPNSVVVPPSKYGSYTDRMARMCLHLRAFIWFDPMLTPGDALGVHYGENVQWLVARKEGFGFAAKGGHNNEPHNHNDAGSFIFAKNRRQVLTDPGRSQYCRDYFDETTRYGFLHTSSKGHSVPIVNGQYQQPGRAFAARHVAWDGETFSMELADAYGVEGLRSLQRSFHISNSGITLIDRMESSVPVTERFVSQELPTAEPGLLRWSDTQMSFSPALLPTVTTETATIEGGKTQTLYLIDIPLPANTTQFNADIR